MIPAGLLSLQDHLAPAKDLGWYHDFSVLETPLSYTMPGHQIRKLSRQRQICAFAYPELKEAGGQSAKLTTGSLLNS
jgi:hypothetical protein